MENEPKIIKLDTHGKHDEGYLCVCEKLKELPTIKRTFWTYQTPENVIRGRHAHHTTEMILIAVTGSIFISTIDSNGHKNEFILNTPNHCLFIPRLCWHEMKYSSDAVQLVLSSTEYNEKDYIRSFKTFSRLIKNKI